VKDDQINFIFSIYNKKNCSESIVQKISFYDELSIGNLIYKNGSRSECLLKGIKRIITRGIKLPENILLDKVYQ